MTEGLRRAGFSTASSPKQKPGRKKKATRLVAAGKPTRPDAARGGGMPKLTTLSEVHGVQNQPKTHILTRRRGADTAHTHKWDGLHTRHLLESTHTR